MSAHPIGPAIRSNALAILTALSFSAAAMTVSPANAAEPAKTAATLAEIEQTFGGVPSFISRMPAAALPGAWQELKDLELSDDTALTAKTKALISLAVAAQIPCQYCVWVDTNSAKAAGATDEEIGEAVAMAALTRHWSTIFNGLQIDFETFKSELSGETAQAK